MHVIIDTPHLLPKLQWLKSSLTMVHIQLRQESTRNFHGAWMVLIFSSIDIMFSGLSKMLSYVPKIKQCILGTNWSGATITLHYTTDCPLRRFSLDPVLWRVRWQKFPVFVGVHRRLGCTKGYLGWPFFCRGAQRERLLTILRWLSGP